MRLPRLLVQAFPMVRIKSFNVLAPMLFDGIDAHCYIGSGGFGLCNGTMLLQRKWVFILDDLARNPRFMDQHGFNPGGSPSGRCW